jgi:deoxyadenosine/deoxycytidine kinase
LTVSPVIGIVGPCAAGKTTLVRELRARGYTVRHIAQEHSYVPYMWQRIAHPDLLVFLDVSYPVTLQRRRLNWSQAEYQEQLRRLQHARQHADLILDTDPLTPEAIVERLVGWIKLHTLDVP